MPIADKLKADNVTIITFGIQSGNFAELFQLSSQPGNEHSFLLDSFTQFESLARKALHTGNLNIHFIAKYFVASLFSSLTLSSLNFTIVIIRL